MSSREEAERIALAVKRACLQAAERALEEAGLAGLCAQGRLDLVMDALRNVRPEAILDDLDD